MIVLEGILVSLTLLLCVCSSIEDLKEGVIRNRTLKCFLVPFLLLDVVYYGFFLRGYALPFLINLMVLVLISSVMYSTHVWAGGDCKLFVTIILGIPARIYDGLELGPVPGFVIFVLVFSIAFLFEVGESLFFTVKNREKPAFSFQKIELQGFLMIYAFTVATIYIINMILAYVMTRLHLTGSLFVIMVDFFAILALNQMRSKISRPRLLIITVMEWVLIFVVFGTSVLTLYSGFFDFRPWLTVIFVFALRAISEKYNYAEIPTSSVRAKMILSSMTVLGFRASRVKGLPTNGSEDLSARLTEEEAAAVRRWEKSKTGRPSVMIVRKVPFAFFISLGTAVFILIEELLIWHIL